WLEAIEESELRTLGEGTTPERDELEAGLDHLHRLALRLLALDAEQERQASAERIQRRAATDREAIDRGVGRLLAAYTPADGRRQTAESAEGALLAACRMIGEQLGVAIEPPPGSEAASAVKDPLGSIARASRLRRRAVTL